MNKNQMIGGYCVFLILQVLYMLFGGAFTPIMTISTSQLVLIGIGIGVALTNIFYYLADED